MKGEVTRFRGSFRCPICGGAEDDARGDGTRAVWGALCRSGMGILHSRRACRAGDQESKLERYAHRIKGNCPCGAEHSPADPVPTRNGKAKLGEIDRVYPYFDLDGKLRFETVRFKNPKDFRQRQPGTNCKPVWNLKGVETILFRLPELFAADTEAPVFIVEGEKDVERLRGLGEIATCNPMGAGKWRRGYAESLRGRKCVIVPDNDDPGRQHGQEVALSLHGVAASIRVVELPGLPEKGDVSDFLDLGGTIDQIRVFADAAQEWMPAATESDQQGDGDGKEPFVHLTDLGNARRLVELFGDRIRYCWLLRAWFIWDGRCWRKDDKGRIFRLAKESVIKFTTEAFKIDDDAKRKEALAWATKSEGRKLIENMVFLAQSEPDIPVSLDSWDKDAWLLNVQNGTVDLKTGRLKPHDKADLITRFAPVKFDDKASCPLWIKTLERIFEKQDNLDADPLPDEQLIGFVQRLFGVFLTGDISEQILPIFYGSGANGKSTILGVMLNLLGDEYGIAAPPNLLVVRQGESHPTERALLHGKRLVVDMESAEGARLNEALVKLLTGSEKIQARGMRQDFWMFDPTHKIAMGTNHRPVIRETKNAIWRRIKLVPFLVELPESEWDTKLPQKLRAEFSGILAWCIRGCLDWQKNGLGVPKVVTEATEEYRKDQDVIGDFLAEECTLVASLWEKATPLYARFSEWAKRTGEIAMPLKVFAKALVERGFERYSNNGICYRGLALRSNGPTESERSY